MARAFGIPSAGQSAVKRMRSKCGKVRPKRSRKCAQMEDKVWSVGGGPERSSPAPLEVAVCGRARARAIARARLGARLRAGAHGRAHIARGPNGFNCIRDAGSPQNDGAMARPECAVHCLAVRVGTGNGMMRAGKGVDDWGLRWSDYLSRSRHFFLSFSAFSKPPHAQTCRFCQRVEKAPLLLLSGKKTSTSWYRT